jgi:hypothetical protein
MASHDPATTLDRTLTDACFNPADMAGIPAGHGDTTAECGRSCFMSGDRSLECVVTCIRDRTACAVSVGCSTCYALSAKCGRTHCVTERIDSSTSDACLSCLCGANTAVVNCFDPVVICSGREPTASCE